MLGNNIFLSKCVGRDELIVCKCKYRMPVTSYHLMASPADVCELCMRWNYDQTQLNTFCLLVLVTHTLG